MENLLQLLKENPEHPYNRFLNISEDFTSITTFQNVDRLIYGKKTCLENLGRDIVVKTIVGEESRYYQEENPTNENNRSDLISKALQDEQVQVLIEFKNIDSDSKESSVRKEVADAFNQIVEKYIKGQPHEHKDCFVTVVLTDVKTLINNPLNIEKFLTHSNEEKEIERELIFAKYGIYIETKRYNSLEKTISNDKVWFDIPKHVILEMSDMKDSFGERYKVSKIQNAIYLPSASSEFGIKNVRDIKDPEEVSAKRMLVEDILDTVIKGFKNKDLNLIANSGKEKDFIFIKDESIIYKKHLEDREKFVVATLNGAIVDGQNSLDAFKIILEIANNIKHNIKLKTNFENNLAQKINEVCFSRDGLEDFISYLKESYVLIKTTEAKTVGEARDMAISKNNTMEVLRSELEASESMERIQIISNFILNKADYIINYPKKRNIGVSEKDFETRLIHIDKLSIYYKMVSDLQKELKNLRDNDSEIETKKIFSYIQRLTKDGINKDSSKKRDSKKSAINVFCQKFSVTEELYDETEEKYKEKQNVLKATIKELKSKINDFIELLEDGAGEKVAVKLESAQTELEKKEAEQEILKSKIKKSKVLKYSTANNKELINLLKSYFTVQNTVKAEYIENENDIFNKSSLIPFIIVVILINNDILFEKSFITETQVRKAMKDMKKMCDWFAVEFKNVSLTDIRNSLEGEVNDKNGIAHSKESVRKMLFNFFK